MARRMCCAGQGMQHYSEEALQPRGTRAELERLPGLQHVWSLARSYGQYISALKNDGFYITLHPDG